MQSVPTYLSPEHWIGHLFASQAARQGGVIRRKVRDVDRFVGREAFLAKCAAAALRWSRMPGNS